MLSINKVWGWDYCRGIRVSRGIGESNSCLFNKLGKNTKKDTGTQGKNKHYVPIFLSQFFSFLYLDVNNYCTKLKNLDSTDPI